jgi:hypothetical protein
MWALIYDIIHYYTHYLMCNYLHGADTLTAVWEKYTYAPQDVYYLKILQGMENRKFLSFVNLVFLSESLCMEAAEEMGIISIRKKSVLVPVSLELS